MSASSIRAGGAYVEISTRNGLLNKGLAAAQASLRRLAATSNAIGATMGKGFSSVGGALSGVGNSLMSVRNLIAGVAAASGVSMMVKGYADAAGAIDDMAKRTGLAAGEIQGLQFAAQMSGASIETVEAAIKKMQKAGVSSGRGTMEDFRTFADIISKIQDPAKRAAEAMKIFGKAGTQLLPMFEGGAAGMDELMAEAERLGLVLSDEAVVAGEELGDTIDKVWTVLGALSNRIGSKLAPLVMELADRFLSLAETVTTFIEDNSDTIVWFSKIAAGVAAAAAGLVALGAVVGGAGAVFTAIGSAIGIVGTVIGAILTPIGLVVTAVLGLGAAFLYFSGVGSQVLTYLQEQFNALLEYVLPIFNAISTALLSGQWAAAGKIAMLALEQVVRMGMQPIYNVWTDLYSWIAEAGVSAVTGLANVFSGIPTSLMNAFSTVITWLTGTWDQTVNYIAKKLLYLYSLFDSSVDYEAAAKEMDKDAARRAKQRQKDLDNVTNKRNEELIQANQRRAEYGEGIKRGIRDQANERKSAFDARIKEIGNEMAEAMQQVQEEYDRQKSEPESKKPPKPKPPEISDVSESVKVKTQGTFSGFTAGLLGTGTSVLDRMEKQSKAQTQLLAAIRDNTDGDDDLLLE